MMLCESANTLACTEKNIVNIMDYLYLTRKDARDGPVCAECGSSICRFYFVIVYCTRICIVRDNLPKPDPQSSGCCLYHEYAVCDT